MSHIIALQLYNVRDETARDFKSTLHSGAVVGNAAVRCAGADPIGFMNKYPGRIVALHLKDMTPDRKLTEVGDGTLDIAGYTKAARLAVPAISLSKTLVQAFHHLEASSAPLKTCVENWNGGNTSYHVLKGRSEHARSYISTRL
jgi:hypothetical protein